jgi:serine/threonine-protein kinase
MHVAGYELVSLLGSGGIGEVWLAKKGRKRVALKFLRKAASQRANRRFEREAEILGKLSSEHVVRVLDFGAADKATPFIVFEYLEGETLSQLLEREGSIPFSVLAPLVDQLLAGLAAAHDQGVVHRDIKPSNVLIAAGSGQIKILDFGMSKFFDDEELLTSAGVTLGTVAFMAPEQALDSRTADLRSDLYSVGAVVFASLTGKLPHTAKSPAVVLALKTESEAPTLSEACGVAWPNEIESLVARWLAIDPGRRDQTAHDARRALATISESVKKSAPVLNNKVELGRNLMSTLSQSTEHHKEQPR